MSVSAWLEVSLVASQGSDLSPRGVLESLLRAGWTFNDNGEAAYLPLGDNDEFNWWHGQASEDEVLSLVETKARAGETVGVVMTWMDSGVGGDFLLAEGTLSVSLSINRVRLKADAPLTDVSWYTQRLLPPLNFGNIRVVSYKYEEHI